MALFFAPWAIIPEPRRCWSNRSRSIRTLPNSHYELGMVLVFLKDWAPARQELEKSIAMGATEPQAHYQLALALRGLGESELAQKELQHLPGSESRR